MKTILDKLSNEQAQKELPKFAWIAFGCSVVALFIAGFLGVIGLGFGFRAFLLTFHKGNEVNRRLWLYRMLSVSALLLGIVDVIWYFIRLHS